MSMSSFTVDDFLRISDEEVAVHWGKLVSAQDQASHEVRVELDKLNPKQKALGELHLSKREVVAGIPTDSAVTDSVYAADYSELTLLVKFSTGEVKFFNRYLYSLEVRGNQIYLIQKDTGAERLVYDGSSGVFFAGKNKWLRKSNAKPGRRSDGGVQWRSEAGIGQILLKDAQIIAGLYFGAAALDAVGDSGSRLVVNHRNLDPTDNRVVNLELLTRSENVRHGRVMRRVLLAKLHCLREILQSQVEDSDEE